MARRELSEAVLSSADHLAPVDLAVGLLTYNNAETLDGVLDTAAAGVDRFPGVRSALIVADAGSSDGTRELATASTIPSRTGVSFRTRTVTLSTANAVRNSSNSLCAKASSSLYDLPRPTSMTFLCTSA